MNPDIFLSQEDVHLLTQAFDALALEMATADDRRNLLINAGVHSGFSSKLNLNSSPYLFANQLVAQYREYRVSELRPIYHPMICLLEYLLQIHDLDDQTRTLFQKLVKQGQENFQGLAARKTVGRIEAPLDVALGTGVLIDQQLILTCKHVVEHVFTRKQEHAWVRFVYKTGRYGIEMGKVFELDIKDIVCQGISADAGQDYALIRIKEKTKQPGAHLFTGFPHPTQRIRLIHHPRGEPVQISDLGEVVVVGNEFIQHNIRTDFGSSGSPIFDQNWNMLAIHRGALDSSHTHALGVTEAVPLYSIWKNIQPHLSV